MAILDGPMRALAQTLAGQFGISGTLTRTTSTYDATEGDTIDTTATHTLTGIIEEPQRGDFGQSIGGDGVIQHGDVWFTVEANSLTIEPDPETDKLALDGVTYAIVGVQPIYSGEQVALYKLLLRN